MSTVLNVRRISLLSLVCIYPIERPFDSLLSMIQIEERPTLVIQTIGIAPVFDR